MEKVKVKIRNCERIRRTSESLHSHLIAQTCDQMAGWY